MIGQTIGKYRIVGPLGRGGMGTVYKAVDDTLDREVAVKVLNPGLAEPQIARFRKEAVTVAKLTHPEIATIYELFRSDSDLLMVMEYVRGETLDKIAQRVGSLPPAHAAHLVDRILSALEHAHGAGIVHCDMKPANVMVTTDGGFKIMDFGIARVRGADHTTVEGHMMGTPAYMPPEQVLGKNVDARSDLYAVGVILYRLLTGALPFKAETAIAMLQQHISSEPTPLSAHREGLPGWCAPILQRALAKGPDDRFQSAEEFRQTLELAIGVLKPESERAYFSSLVDLDAMTESAPGELERFGLTRLWGANSPRTTTPPTGVAGVGVPAPIETTLVLPKRAKLTPLLLVALAVAVAAAAVLQPWRSAVRPAPRMPDVPLPFVESLRPYDPETLPAVPIESALSFARSEPAVPRIEAVPSSTPPAPRARPGIESAPAATREAPAAAPIERAPAPAPEPAGAAPVPTAAPPAAPPDPPLPAIVVSPGAPKTSPYVFDARALVWDGDRTRERESQIFLVDGRINVKATDDDSVLYSLPASAVLSISYSRGRDPFWEGPAGPTRVTRAGGGLGIFRGTRHWVSLRLKQADAEFLVLRLGNRERAQDAMAALEARTGRRTSVLADDF